jgi:hypothetical protein
MWNLWSARNPNRWAPSDPIIDVTVVIPKELRLKHDVFNASSVSVGADRVTVVAPNDALEYLVEIFSPSSSETRLEMRLADTHVDSVDVHVPLTRRDK